MTTKRRFITVDVFTDRRFGGNPLAVILDAAGLATDQMQLIAREFRYSETTFVLPPREPTHTAQVRIFTGTKEVPFAGHPNIGTALVLARAAEADGAPLPEQLVFEEIAGLVPVRLLRDGARITGAELTAPEALSVGVGIRRDEAAACLCLEPGDIETVHHEPQVLSVGLPFLVAELRSREVLARAQPDAAAHRRLLPPIGTDAVYGYVRDADPARLHARMFSPLDACPEDPATGSAAGATVARLAALLPERDAALSWHIHQGVDMGRASRIVGRVVKRGGRVESVHVAGNAVQVMSGLL
ncbi:MAG: PhzF family phenazine biosynthesis protein [Gammaproteobacteria bacterium]|nr:PhzF family phenazine biosynthesis protein [Gammaproteobacteria bacterium]